MTFRKIAPLGPRTGPGTFDTVFRKETHPTMEEALADNEVGIVDFVENEEGIRYFEAYYSKTPEIKYHRMLEIQDFPFGIDMIDDGHGYLLGVHAMEEYERSATDGTH